MFKSGDLVECINTGINTDISVGTTYVVLSTELEYIRIRDNTWKKNFYMNKRFRLIEEENE